MIPLHPEIARALGIEEIPEALLNDCLARAKLRCSNVEAHLYRRRPLQAMMVAVAKEAVVATYNDYFPHSDKRVTNSWPWATCTIKGNSARIEIWIGQDYDDGDGLEPFDITIDRKLERGALGKILAMFDQKKPEPELVLAKKVEPAPAPKTPEPVGADAPVKKAASRGRDILNGDRAR